MVDDVVQVEDDLNYKELQEVARLLGVPVGGSKDELEARVEEAARAAAIAEERLALEAEYGPFIVNLWQGRYPNFGCPVETCDFLYLAETREEGENLIAAHYAGAHSPVGVPGSTGLLGPDGQPL